MLLKVPLIYNIIHRNVSASFITGDKVHQNYAVLRPYLDFNVKLNNKEKLEQNLRRRKLNVDLNELHLLRQRYLDELTKKNDLELKLKDIANAIRNVDPKVDGNEALITKLKIEGKEAKNGLNALKEIEHEFIPKFLCLPNDIHDRTPLDANKVCFSHFDQQNSRSDAENHLNKLDYLEYHDPFCYFLKSDAAKFDLRLPLYCMDMLRSFGFLPFSNPDFVRSILPEGAAVNMNDLLTLVEYDLENKSNLLHLVGSGSMLSFLGYVTKLFVYETCLPLKFVSSGKSFSIRGTEPNEDGLYAACQTTNVQLFSMAIDESESLHLYDETLGQMIEFYKRLDRSFRVSYVASDGLNQAEELRAIFEIYSFHRKCFVSVGHLSSYGDYVSKRLLLAFKDKGKQYKFPHLIAGNVINVTSFLAILLEEKGDVLRIPKILANFK